MRYLPHTEEEIGEMLQVIGVPSIDALFESMPEHKRLREPLKLDTPLDESALMEHLQSLAAQNTAATQLSFLGAGAYTHHIPPAVDQLLLRGEFYTAYTPYQAEVAQGTLQAIFEFQTLVCQLFGMDVANSSMYDGASATAEAVLMARRVTQRGVCLLSQGLHPEYADTVRSYIQWLDEGTPLVDEVALAPDGATDLDALSSKLNSQVAAVVVGYPNVMGSIEDLDVIRARAHEHGALVITATPEPYSLALVKAPGECGIDIAVGEGQPLAGLPQMGGPGVGLFSCKERYLRNMPGRLVGASTDAAGQTGYVLTLTTREQHIRRERATSNICTNQGLVALAFSIRLALLGKTGFVHVAQTCLDAALYLRDAISRLPDYEIPYSAPIFNEFVVRATHRPAEEILKALLAKDILGGVALSRFFPDRIFDFLVAVTERHKKADLDRFVEALRANGKKD
ncbi:MAG: aminomethyl-transferring glycine dehydrogenase subunit GcvPA [Myxococcales bacterium]|nr:aminomethyl-transferring glycine dehydrogenase subunit GcvPA [Myxococcales bacterium]MCB9709195.1 aminomethyl-transferring glycine dehydrogenase subunit GcvPA [Myxococcales bacterium]